MVGVKPKIEKFLKSKGYTIFLKFPKWFTLRPDFYCEKEEEQYVFYIRYSNSIPDSLIQRVSFMKKGKSKIYFYIIFYRKPTKKTLLLTSKYGVGAKLFIKDKLIDIKVKKTLESKEKERKKHKRLLTIKIFISSHQIIDERREAKELIEVIAQAQKWPLFPICIEYDHRYTIKQTDRCEKENIENSDWFIGILAESYRSEVKKEINKALENFNQSNIIVLVKSNKQTRDQWKNLLSGIDKNKKIKYIPYIDLSEMKSVLLSNIMDKMKKIHDRKGIPFIA